jgi:tetratricopeptide (TPR) repeat protein
VSEAESVLPDDVYERVSDLSERGNNLFEVGRIDEAIAIWQSALALLPEPREKWEASMWLHASIGDAQQQSGRIQDALYSFQKAAASADGYANGFIQLGIGKSLFDLGRTEESTDPLLRAFMAEGEDIFEESSPKYLDHLRRQKLIN